jgi:hypothetical protein
MTRTNPDLTCDIFVHIHLLFELTCMCYLTITKDRHCQLSEFRRISDLDINNVITLIL